MNIAQNNHSPLFGGCKITMGENGQNVVDLKRHGGRIYYQKNLGFVYKHKQGDKPRLLSEQDLAAISIGLNSHLDVTV